MTLGAELQAVIDALKQMADSRKTLSDIHDLLSANVEREKTLMSQITDWAAQEQANLDTISSTLDAIVAGVAALDKLITDFQNSPGTLSPADQAALDAIQASSKNLVTKVQAISTVPPASPVPGA